MEHMNDPGMHIELMGVWEIHIGDLGLLGVQRLHINAHDDFEVRSKSSQETILGCGAPLLRLSRFL